MRSIGIAILAAGLSACSHMSPSHEILPGDHPRADEIRSAMRHRMMVPLVDLRRVPILDALTFMRDASEKYDTNRCGVGFVFVVDSPRSASTPETEITISARDIAVYDLLNEICRQGGLVWRMSTSGIVLQLEQERSNHRVHRSPLRVPGAP